LSVVVAAIDGYRPEPPRDFHGSELEYWRNIVSSVPGGWFSRANEPLLAAYCRHAATGERLTMLIDDLEASREPEDLRRWARLLAMRDRESKVALALARAMRLTQQSQMHPRSAGRAMADAGGPKLWKRKPWEDC
jgi:hypothetical protein